MIPIPNERLLDVLLDPPFVVEPLRRCSRCGLEKALAAFPRDRHRRNGHRGTCKTCTRKYRREYERRNPGHAAAGARLYHQRNPEKRAARRALQEAVARGDIERPGCCEDCGRMCKPHGHHNDYAKPLDVEWLCRDCHWRRHAAETAS